MRHEHWIALLFFVTMSAACLAEDTGPSPKDKALAECKKTALRWSRDKDFSAAREGFAEALSLDAKCALALFNLGMLEDLDGNAVQAIANFEKAIALDQVSDESVKAQVRLDDLRKIAATQEGLKRHKFGAKLAQTNQQHAHNKSLDALNTSRELQKIDSTRWEGFALEGSLLMELKADMRAFTSISKALELAPVEKNEVLKVALEHCRPAADNFTLKLKPHISFWNQAQELSKSGKFEEAGDLLAKMFDLLPEFDDLGFYAALQYDMAGKPEKCVVLCRKLIQSKDLEISEYARHLEREIARVQGAKLVANGKYEDAGDFYLKAFEDYPDYGVFGLRAALYYWQAGKPTKSESILEKLTKSKDRGVAEEARLLKEHIKSSPSSMAKAKLELIERKKALADELAEAEAKLELIERKKALADELAEAKGAWEETEKKRAKIEDELASVYWNESQRCFETKDYKRAQLMLQLLLKHCNFKNETDVNRAEALRIKVNDALTRIEDGMDPEIVGATYLLDAKQHLEARNFEFAKASIELLLSDHRLGNSKAAKQAHELIPSIDAALKQKMQEGAK